MAKIVVLAALFAAATCVTLAPGTTAAPPRPALLQLPPTTGPARVATIARLVVDPSRRRRLMIQLWYPTLATHGRPAAYLPRKVALLAAVVKRVPLRVVSAIATHALDGALAAPGHHPVILYSPGSGELRSDASALCEELASRGYVVAAIDHTGQSPFVEFPDGHVVRGDAVDTGPASNLRVVRVFVADAAAVLRALAGIDRRGLLAGHLDPTRVGMFGFSLGGATAAAAMRALPEIRAGVDLDGSLYGSPLTTPLDRPFLLVSEAVHGPSTDPTWQAGWRELTGFRREIGLLRTGPSASPT